MTDQDREWVRLTVETITKDVVKCIIEKHIESCPIGQNFRRGKAIMIGIGIGLFIGGSGAGVALFKILTVL